MNVACKKLFERSIRLETCCIKDGPFTEPYRVPGDKADATLFMQQLSKSIWFSIFSMCAHTDHSETLSYSRETSQAHHLSLSHLLGPGHISPPVHSLDVQHSATLGEASLGIMYCPLSLTGIFWSGVSKLTLLKGSDSAASSLSLSVCIDAAHTLPSLQP